MSLHIDLKDLDKDISRFQEESELYDKVLILVYLNVQICDKQSISKDEYLCKTSAKNLIKGMTRCSNNLFNEYSTTKFFEILENNSNKVVDQGLFKDFSDKS